VRLSKTGIPAANRVFALPEKRSEGENMVNHWFTARPVPAMSSYLFVEPVLFQMLNQY
jgi:hypothetical protein